MKVARENKMQPDQDRIDTVVIGLGVTGLSCARFLAARGIPFAVSDSRDNPPNAQTFSRDFPSVPLSLGGFDAARITGARRLLVSPGVSLAEPVIREAMARGCEVIGDIELFAQHAHAPVVAITGANGKSTVTTLVGEMARTAGKTTGVGGNLGTAALDLITSPEPELYVLELSSFQLETTHSLRTATSVVLNITPDHMDRYATVAEYASAKQRIYQGAQVRVINGDDPWVTAMQDPRSEIIRFTLEEPGDNDFGIRRWDGVPWLSHGRNTLMPVSQLRIKGSHNVANALASVALGSAIGLPLDAMLETLKAFPGLPHRCQWVARARGVDWYNDSKGTNVGAACAAIRGLAEAQPLVLIAGGDGKGADFAPLAEAVAGRVRTVVMLGRDAPLIEAALGGLVPVRRVRDMREAVQCCAGLARKGDAVLLSPACASLDMFKNYAERGEVFVSAVRELGAG
jgi:UDP-N-acetylmuramoylalanine--D-glutamate ligase